MNKPSCNFRAGFDFPSRCLPLLIVGFLLVTCCNVFAQADPFESLFSQLRQDGFSEDQIAIIRRSAGAPLFQTVSNTLHIRESKLNYEQFLDPSRLNKAEQFLQTHWSTLVRAEKGLGVDRTVIVAILLVETQLGQYTGKTPTLAILSTFALMDRESSRDAVWALLTEQDRTHWGRDAFDRKMLQRSKWAYAELCALLQWSEAQGFSAESCRGSVMGAVGWPQFLPSSMVHYAMDGNHDGRIDLYTPQDAIFSVANYLRGHGWPQAKDQAAKEAVIYGYNKSQPYVQTVLEIASRIQ
ncbi:lytic murein transglycosylase [Desulforhabdus amnigena]|uniref:Transglycosylase SLT domain-containing protein n=1 Tax=Desulforhabdus amnigena TaxID=40218 RepID=A0A9W6FVX0_9BACT|nr:lytic murein transglycosylase [Desulforhabdus amnigena]GLI35808.1 hypothetical protein DAMNIGENAA_32410 [Desulforhabdus amnigena]